MEPGLYPNMSHRRYRELDRLSNSYFGKLDRSPAYAKIPQVETPTLTFGRAFHCFLLEGEAAFYQEFVFAPEINRRTKDGKAYWEQFQLENTGKTVLQAEDKQVLEDMVFAVATHPLAAKLLTEGRSEVSVLWTDAKSGVEMKCRPDRIPDGDRGVIADVKTVRSADERAFQRAAVDFGYAREAAIYIEGYNSVCNGKIDAFPFICCEKDPPYRVEVWVLDEDFIDWGYSEYRRLLNIELECRKKNFWPHYKNAGAGTILMPNYLHYGR